MSLSRVPFSVRTVFNVMTADVTSVCVMRTLNVEQMINARSRPPIVGRPVPKVNVEPSVESDVKWIKSVKMAWSAKEGSVSLMMSASALIFMTLSAVSMGRHTVTDAKLDAHARKCSTMASVVHVGHSTAIWRVLKASYKMIKGAISVDAQRSLNAERQMTALTGLILDARRAATRVNVKYVVAMSVDPMRNVHGVKSA